jgi:uncharacterized protein
MGQTSKNLKSSLKERIFSDLKEFLKTQNEIGVQTLRLLLAAILQKEKEKRYRLSSNKNLSEKELLNQSQLTADEILEVLFSEIKKRKEAILIYEKAKRQDLFEKEKKELAFLESYLPKQLTEEELEEILKRIIEETGAQDLKDLGKVMAKAMPQIKGKAEGSRVSALAKKLLSAL